MARRWVDVTERAIYLRSIPVAAELPPKVLHAVAHSLTEREFQVGDKLLEVGKPVRALELLTVGKLVLQRDGKQLGEMTPPQSVGFLNILARNDATYDAVVVEPSHALELSAERFYELVEDHYPLLVATLRYIAQRMLAEMQELPQEALGLKAMDLPLAIPDREMDLVERVFFLRCMSAFSKTNLGALAILAELMDELRVPEGHTVFELGAPSEFTLFILSGWVTCETADGRRFEYGPGTAVGGVEALANQRRWYTVTTRTPLIGLRGRADDLLALMEDNFGLGGDFIRVLATGLQGLMAMKAARGQSVFAVRREVSNLGSVPVGA